MPTPTTDFILATRAVPTSIALEPVLNALNSLMILTKKEYMPGTPIGSPTTAASLTPAQLHTHHLVFIGMYHALTIEVGHVSFLDYVNTLARREPARLRDTILDIYLNHPPIELPEEIPVPTAAELLSDVTFFIDYLRLTYPPDSIFPDIEEEAHRLLNHPTEMQTTIVKRQSARRCSQTPGRA